MVGCFTILSVIVNLSHSCAKPHCHRPTIWGWFVYPSVMFDMVVALIQQAKQQRSKNHTSFPSPSILQSIKPMINGHDIRPKAYVLQGNIPTKYGRTSMVLVCSTSMMPRGCKTGHPCGNKRFWPLRSTGSVSTAQPVLPVLGPPIDEEFNYQQTGMCLSKSGSNQEQVEFILIHTCIKMGSF